jgi:hypothetical protein
MPGVFIDVPRTPKPKSLPGGAGRREGLRFGIPGSSWSRDTGYKRLAAATEAQSHLSAALQACWTATTG